MPAEITVRSVVQALRLTTVIPGGLRASVEAMSSVLLQPEVAIKVFAASDPVVSCSFVTPGDDGRVVPYDLTGAQVEFYRKPRAEDPDGLPLYSTTEGTVVTDAAGGLATVQFDQHDIRYAGSSRYHIDAVQAGRRVVLAWGTLVVVDR